MAIISNCTASIIKDAALALKEGRLVAFPTETVYGLGADATNERAVARIYEVKGRPTDHPLIVHISSMELMDKWASEIPEYAIKLARAFWPGPMTLVLKRTDMAKDFITGGQDTVAIRIPNHVLALKFLKNFEDIGGYGVVAPSANRFGKVSPTSAYLVKLAIGSHLSHKDLILDGGESSIGIESTIIDCTSINPIILRPGFITYEDLSEFIHTENYKPSNTVRISGSYQSHYAPNTEVVICANPSKGDGFIAMEDVLTPSGSIRLASPKTDEEFAHLLYSSLMLADLKGIKKVCIHFSSGTGIKVAIEDRLIKMTSKVLGHKNQVK